MSDSYPESQPLRMHREAGANTKPAAGIVRRLLPSLAIATGLAVTAASPVHADAVTDWNETAETTAITYGGPPPFQMRIMAMVQVAVHDALNAIHPRYTSYTGQSPASAGASPEAAVAAATYQVLLATVTLNATQRDALTATYANRLDGLPDCPAAYPGCIDDGVAAGEAAAAAIITLRTGDGSASPHRPYTLQPAPGVHQPTPPNYPAPAFAGWAEVTPFAINSAWQFRADPSEILDLTSDVYTRDYNEVKNIGAKTARDAAPDSEPSKIARFWPGGGANWNSVTRVIVPGRGLDMWQHAQLFALLNMAMSDALVTVFDTKYHYNFWRPATAIRTAEDGNPATAPDPDWLSYQTTPPYPDYTCGLTTLTGSAVEVLRRYLRTDDIAYTFSATWPPAVPPITRSFSSLSEAAAEAVDARVFGGMHFRTGCVHGVRHGEQVGRFVFQHELKALKSKGKAAGAGQMPATRRKSTGW